MTKIEEHKDCEKEIHTLQGNARLHQLLTKFGVAQVQLEGGKSIDVFLNSKGDIQEVQHPNAAKVVLAGHLVNTSWKLNECVDWSEAEKLVELVKSLEEEVQKQVPKKLTEFLNYFRDTEDWDSAVCIEFAQSS